MDIDNFIPDLELTEEEVGSIGAIKSHPGFQAYQKVWRHVVTTFTLAMINTEQDEKETVLARHNAARVAAQLYTGVTNRVNQEINDFMSSRPSSKPIDSTPNLDLGEHYIGEEPII